MCSMANSMRKAKKSVQDNMVEIRMLGNDDNTYFAMVIETGRKVDIYELRELIDQYFTTIMMDTAEPESRDLN